LEHLKSTPVQLKDRLHCFRTEHLKKNKKDFSTQQALIKLVGKRRRLLDYLKIKDIGRYREIIKALKLRK
jgi:small subunit ribosomal protein S15